MILTDTDALNKIGRHGGGHLGFKLERCLQNANFSSAFDKLGCYCKHKIDYLGVSSNQMSTNSASISINLEINHTKHKN